MSESREKGKESSSNYISTKSVLYKAKSSV